MLEVLAAYWSDKIALTWSVADVQNECPILTEAEARAVLDKVLHRYDANLGVTWDTVGTAALELFPDHYMDEQEEEDV